MFEHKYTHNEQTKSMFDECSTTSEKRDDKNKYGESKKDIDANIVRVDVKDFYPLLKSRLHTNPDCERK